MTRVKICGLCRAVDAAAAADAGADYAGVILAPDRARSQSLRGAAEILAAASDLRRVGVFIDATAAELIEAAGRLELDVLQLHGAEPPELVAEVRAAGAWSIWKAVGARSASDLLAAVERYAGVADGVLADGWAPAAAGGSGVRFPWDEVAAARSRVPTGLTFIAAGGLDPENVATAVRVLGPDIVDVSSGVERVVGEKSERRIRAFVEAAKGVNR